MRSTAGWVGVLLGLHDFAGGGHREEEVSVPNRLCDDEDGVQGSEAIAAKASCAGVNSGPGRPSVNVGSTRLKVASVVTVASAAPVPSALKIVRWKRTPPISSAIPTMPLHVIMTAANTVSRAREAVPGPPAIISVTINATSMIVTATASTSDPNGSPTRWATTSA